MLQAYTDDSGTGGPVVVMASFVSTTENWAAFSEEWDAVRKSGKAISHLKMADAFCLTGEFRGFSDEERDAKIFEFVRLINKHILLGSVCIIDGAAYKRV